MLMLLCITKKIALSDLIICTESIKMEAFAKLRMNSSMRKSAWKEISKIYIRTFLNRTFEKKKQQYVEILGNS